MSRDKQLCKLEMDVRFATYFQLFMLRNCTKIDRIAPSIESKLSVQDSWISPRYEYWEFTWNRLEISIHIPISLPYLSWILNVPLIKVKYPQWSKFKCKNGINAYLSLKSQWFQFDYHFQISWELVGVNMTKNLTFSSGRHPKKKYYFKRALPIWGGGGRPLPDCFGPFFTKY